MYLKLRIVFVGCLLLPLNLLLLLSHRRLRSDRVLLTRHPNTIRHNEKQNILYACHSDLTSGQLGIKRTIKRIRDRFTWKGLNKEVIELVGIRRSILHDIYTVCAEDYSWNTLCIFSYHPVKFM